MMIESQSHKVSNTQTTTATINVDHNEKLIMIPREKPQKFEEILDRFQFKWDRDSIGEARSTLLIVVALIATVTFQAGINPPSFFFDESSNPSLTTMIVYLFVNSIGFSTAVVIIDYLTGGLPFQRELRVSLLAMSFCYGWSIGKTKPTGTLKTCLLIVALFLPFLMRPIALIIKKIGKVTEKMQDLLTRSYP